MKLFKRTAVFSASLLLGATQGIAPIANAQDYTGNFYEDAQAFSSTGQTEEFQFGLRQDVEARIALRLRIPFGGPATTYEANKPRMSLNIGIAQPRDWQNVQSGRNYSNILELGTTFDGHDYMSLGNQPFDYNAILRAQEEDVESDGSKKTGKRIGITAGVLIGAAAVAVGTGLIIVATDSGDE